MVSVAEASEIVFSNLFQSSAIKVPLVEAVGQVLAEPIAADRDFPPFHRVAMDGIAIAFEAWKEGRREFILEGTQAAGQQQSTLSNRHHAIEVMTGAVLPEGTDVVIRYEDVSVAEGKAMVQVETIQSMQHVHAQGIDARQNAILLEQGMLISPAEIALMASVGKPTVSVYSLPKAAVVSSGNELVGIDQLPSAYEIRRSNTYALQAAMRLVGWKSDQHHLRDEKEQIIKSLRRLVADHDVLILSGGVSKGKFDYMPEALEAIGVRKLFHQVSQRPGKPFWFGATREGKTVFALPGNPVSTYMCFYRYVLPWLWKSLHADRPNEFVTLARDVNFQPSLTYFLQVNVGNEKAKLMAYPVPGGGSGDFANLKNVSGFIELPHDREQFLAGEVFPYFPFR